jgi:hypothetical protein
MKINNKKLVAKIIQTDLWMLMTTGKYIIYKANYFAVILIIKWKMNVMVIKNNFFTDFKYKFLEN